MLKKRTMPTILKRKQNEVKQEIDNCSVDSNLNEKPCEVISKTSSSSENRKRTNSQACVLDDIKIRVIDLTKEDNIPSEVVPSYSEKKTEMLSDNNQTCMNEHIPISNKQIDNAVVSTSQYKEQQLPQQNYLSSSSILTSKQINEVVDYATSYEGNNYFDNPISSNNTGIGCKIYQNETIQKLNMVSPLLKQPINQDRQRKSHVAQDGAQIISDDEDDRIKQEDTCLSQPETPNPSSNSNFHSWDDGHKEFKIFKDTDNICPPKYSSDNDTSQDVFKLRPEMTKRFLQEELLKSKHPSPKKSIKSDKKRVILRKKIVTTHNPISLKDYISYNPITEPPMIEQRNTDEETEIKQENESNEDSSHPKLVVKDGRIVIDTKSVRVNQARKTDPIPRKTYANWKEKAQKRSWKLVDTVKFYYILWKFGIDYTMISKVVPTYSRSGLKSKFNFEKKHHSKLLEATLYDNIEQFKIIVKRLIESTIMERNPPKKTPMSKWKTNTYKSLCQKGLRIKRKASRKNDEDDQSPSDKENNPLVKEEEHQEQEKDDINKLLDIDRQASDLIIQLNTALTYSGIQINESLKYDAENQDEVDCNWTIVHS